MYRARWRSSGRTDFATRSVFDCTHSISFPFNVLSMVGLKEYIDRNRKNRTETSTILGANWRHANIQELHAPGKILRTPHACTEYIERTKRKSSVVSRWDWQYRRVLRASHQYRIHGKGVEKEQRSCIVLRFTTKASISRIAPASATLRVVAYIPRADFDSFVRFANAVFDYFVRFANPANCQTARWHASSLHDVCVLGFPRSGRHVHAMLSCAGRLRLAVRCFR